MDACRGSAIVGVGTAARVGAGAATLPDQSDLKQEGAVALPDLSLRRRPRRHQVGPMRRVCGRPMAAPIAQAKRCTCGQVSRKPALRSLGAVAEVTVQDPLITASVADRCHAVVRGYYRANGWG